MSDLTFAVVGARAEPFAAAPTLVFRLRVAETGGAEVHTIALRCQIRIEPRRRAYSSTEGERLLEVFGPPAQWADSLQTLVWTHATLMVPGFQGATEVDLPISCTYDLEVAATKYFHALDAGEIPIRLFFSGTVFLRTATGFSVYQVPWTQEAAYRLPVAVWRAMMDAFFPGSAWVRLRRESVDALLAFKGRRALPTWDDAIAALLEHASASELA
jgi:uncharacterized protein DUF6084